MPSGESVYSAFPSSLPSIERASPEGQQNRTARFPRARIGRSEVPILLYDLRHNPCADSTSTFPNCEAQALVHRDRSDQLYADRDVIAWHDPLGPFRPAHFARHLGRPDVELAIGSAS